MLREGPEDNPGRIELGFRLALARPPAPEEKARLGQLLAQQLEKPAEEMKIPAGWKLIAPAFDSLKNHRPPPSSCVSCKSSRRSSFTSHAT